MKYPTSVNGLLLELLADTPDIRSTTVKLYGEIDVSNASALRDVLELASKPDQRVIVDMAGVSFIDSSGIGVLVSVLGRAGIHHSGLVVQNPSANVLGIVRVLGLEATFGLDGSEA